MSKELKEKIISAGYKAVEHLIEVAEEKIVQKHTGGDGEVAELAADRLKNAAATKRIAIFDAFEILNRIETEKEALESIEKGPNKVDTKQGFAERRSR
jgi:adenosine/AMP kinase